MTPFVTRSRLVAKDPCREVFRFPSNSASAIIFPVRATTISLNQTPKTDMAKSIVRKICKPCKSATRKITKPCKRATRKICKPCKSATSKITK